MYFGASVAATQHGPSCVANGSEADGRTAEEFAEGAKLSMNTVRTQIRALLTKTCLNRQADLLRLLARLPRLRGPRASA